MDAGLTDHDVKNMLVLPKSASFPFFILKKQEGAFMTNICFEHSADHTNERLKLMLLSLRKLKFRILLSACQELENRERTTCACWNYSLTWEIPKQTRMSEMRHSLPITSCRQSYVQQTYMYGHSWSICVLRDTTIVRIHYSRFTGAISIQGEHAKYLDSVTEALDQAYLDGDNRSVVIIEFSEMESFQGFSSSMACIFSQSSCEFEMKEMGKPGKLIEHIVVPLTSREVSVVGQVYEACKTDNNLSRLAIEERANEFGGVLRHLLGDQHELHENWSTQNAIKTSTVVGDLSQYNVPPKFKHFVTPYPLYGTKTFDFKAKTVFVFLSRYLRNTFLKANPPGNLLKKLDVSCSAENKYLVSKLLSNREQFAVAKRNVYHNTQNQVVTKNIQPVAVPGLFLIQGRPHGISFFFFVPHGHDEKRSCVCSMLRAGTPV
jgi:hypothetical protein